MIVRRLEYTLILSDFPHFWMTKTLNLKTFMTMMLKLILDFSEESISTDIILTVINSIASQAITPVE